VLKIIKGMIKNKHLFISLIGGIGSGKSTATALLAKSLGFKEFQEQYQTNEFLPLFYKDMKRWALTSQFFFMFEKFKQVFWVQKALKKSSVVLDVDIHQDLFYVWAQKKLGYLDGREYRLYAKIHKFIVSLLPRPDLIVYLRAESNVLQERIRSRARDCEQNIPQKYLEALIEAQESWFKKNKNKLPILVVDIGLLNLVKKEADRKKFVALVKNSLKN
jgi:deoxyadenosine/deoxycytidine kinase